MSGMRIRKMSPMTNQMDLNGLARKYLESIGKYDSKKRVGSLEIWCRYEGLYCTKAGPTKESVTPEYKT